MSCAIERTAGVENDRFSTILGSRVSLRAITGLKEPSDPTDGAFCSCLFGWFAKLCEFAFIAQTSPAAEPRRQLSNGCWMEWPSTFGQSPFVRMLQLFFEYRRRIVIVPFMGLQNVAQIASVLVS